MLEQLDLFNETMSKEAVVSKTSPVHEREPQIPVAIIPEEKKNSRVNAFRTVSKSQLNEKATKSSRGRKSQKEMSLDAELVEIPGDDILFQKQYYGIGEVAEMFHVNASLLRYWETEFDILKPRKNRKGDRFFRPEDIKNLQLIYHLLRHRKYTIGGAKDFLKQNKKSREKFEIIQSLEKLRTFMLDLKASL
jgi:DNA-binding transcriptional MerR regulator